MITAAAAWHVRGAPRHEETPEFPPPSNRESERVLRLVGLVAKVLVPKLLKEVQLELRSGSGRPRIDDGSSCGSRKIADSTLDLRSRS